MTLGGAEQLRKPPDVKRWALWAALVLGVVVLGWMAWRLSREMAAATATDEAEDRRTPEAERYEGGGTSPQTAATSAGSTMPDGPRSTKSTRSESRVGFGLISTIAAPWWRAYAGSIAAG